MGFVHADATITPTKDELLAAWVPTQSWGGEVVRKIGAYRFDDPTGVVGTETFLLELTDGRTVHVPLSYRGEPLDGVDPVTTMEHTKLGKRWIYDGMVDPLYVSLLLGSMLAGVEQAVEEFEWEGERRTRISKVKVNSSGAPTGRVDVATSSDPVSDAVSTTVVAGGRTVVLARVVPSKLTGDVALTATWPGQDEPGTLAVVRRS